MFLNPNERQDMTENEFLKQLPAFPFEHRQGMTLRDYFAAKAMAIVLPPVLEEISKRNISEEHVKKLKQVSTEACYALADAMLKAREQ